MGNYIEQDTTQTSFQDQLDYGGAYGVPSAGDAQNSLQPTFSSPIDEVQKKHKFRIGSIAQK